MNIPVAKYPVVIVCVLITYMANAMFAFSDSLFIQVTSGEKATWRVKWDVIVTEEDIVADENIKAKNYIEKTGSGKGEELFYVGETTITEESSMLLNVYFENLTKDDFLRTNDSVYWAYAFIVIETDEGSFSIGVGDTNTMFFLHN